MTADPLESLLRPFAAALNRQLRAHTPARALCRELAGRNVAVRVKDTGLAAWFLIDPDGVRIVGGSDAEPDLVLTGSLLALGGLVAGDSRAAIREGRVALVGDAELAEQFQRLLGYARPDLEEGLAAVIGDTAAHRVGRLAREVGDWTRRTASTVQANVGEYLTEERGDLPARGETDEFYADVERLRDGVERAEARLRLLERSD